jgi:hypothetical protein
MNRTTIMLPDDLQRQAADLAARQGISMGEFIRRSVAREAAVAYQVGVADEFWNDPPLFRSGQTDLSERHDEALYGPVR